MSLELKVKSKTLAEEARIIRREERKLKKQIEWAKIRQLVTDPTRSVWESLNSHRRVVVRNEQRGTYLARAFIAGVPYKEVEQKRKPEYAYKFVNKIIPRVVSMVNKYGDKSKEYTAKDILAWVDAE